MFGICLGTLNLSRTIDPLTGTEKLTNDAWASLDIIFLDDAGTCDTPNVKDIESAIRQISYYPPSLQPSNEGRTPAHR